MLSFPNVSSEAQQVQIFVNGQLYNDWQPLESEHEVKLNHRGMNYIKADLRFADNSTRTLYANTELSDPLLFPSMMAIL